MPWWWCPGPGPGPPPPLPRMLPGMGVEVTICGWHSSREPPRAPRNHSDRVRIRAACRSWTCFTRRFSVLCRTVIIPCNACNSIAISVTNIHGGHKGEKETEQTDRRANGEIVSYRPWMCGNTEATENDTT